ncbi:MAG: hypothetical protein NWR42_03085 [Desulfobacterales bacterium]|jgi:hypothetical protein|nr:hypothetical protein [Desulfobacterales bacterium]
MEDENHKYQLRDDMLPQPSSRDLRGRQSVRATFKLTAKAIETMSAVSIHLGIKQKSLFDHLVDDIKALEVIAREVQTTKFDEPSRVQKTFVLSRRTLNSLELASVNFQTPRDALVEYSIQRLLPVITKEKEKHQNRKALLSRINGFLESGEQIMREAREWLGEEDPVFDELARAMTVLLNARDDIAAFIDKGKIIEKF